MSKTMLEQVDALANWAGISRNDFIREALRCEIKRRKNERFEQEHQASFEREPPSGDESWTPSKRAWGDE